MRILYSFLLCCLAQTAQAQFTATITAVGNTTFCSGGSVLLTANLGDTYQWYLNGTSIAGATNDSLVVSAGGSYEVEIDSAGNIDLSNPEVVTVNTAPAQPGTITGPTQICSDAVQTYSVGPVPGATAYIWHKPVGFYWSDAVLDTTSGPSFTGVMGMSYHPSSPNAMMIVKAMNSCGVSGADTLQILDYSPLFIGGMNPHPPPLGFYCPPTVGLWPSLYANWHPAPSGYSTITAYQWKLNGAPIPGATGQWLDIYSGGNYSVDMYCGVCVGTQTNPFLATCMPTPSVYPVGPVTICVGSTMELHVAMDMNGYVGNVFHWYWTLNGVQIPGTDDQYSITPQTAGNYAVRMQNMTCTNQTVGTVNCIGYTTPDVAVSFSNFVAPNVSFTQVGNVYTATPGFASYQWYRNGVLIPGANSDTYTAIQPGTYTVVVNDGNMCTAMYRVGLGVENINSTDFDLVVYPNPNNGSFTVGANVPKEDRTATLSVSDLAGKILSVRTIQIQNGTVEEQISTDANLPAGLYLLKLTTENYNKVVSFVKQ